MTESIVATLASRLLFVLVGLFAPWFYLRWGGFDFSSGTSLSLVDLFLFAGLALFLLRLIDGTIPAQALQGLQKVLLSLGTAFVVLGLASGFTWIWATSEPVRWPALLSGLSQYGFALIALPLISMALLGGQRATWVLRILCIGSLVPMVVNLILLRPDVLPQINFMFVSVNRAIGSYGNANSFSGVIGLMLPYYLYIAYTDDSRWKRLGTFGSALSLTCLLLTVSFGGYLVVAACLGANVFLILVWTQHPARRSLKALALQTSQILLIFLCISLLAAVYSPIVEASTLARLEASLSGKADSIGSAGQRLGLIYSAFELIADRQGGLFYGHGLRQTTFMDKFAFNGVHLDVHLVYLLLWIEGGALLAVVFLAYLTILFFGCLVHLKERPGLTIAAASSVLAFILMGMVMPHIYLRYFWIPLMPAMALAGGYFCSASRGMAIDG